MKLVIFNGSPRSKESNTDIFLKNFVNGFSHVETVTYEKYYLKKIKNNQQHIDAFKNADAVLLAFPLYTDSFPGIVKFFIDSLKPAATATKKLGFIFYANCKSS